MLKILRFATDIMDQHVDLSTVSTHFDNITKNLQEYENTLNRKERKNKKYIALLRAEYTRRADIIEEINSVYTEIRYLEKNSLN